MKELTTEPDFASALDETGVAVIDFFTTWCGPCKTMSPVLEALSKEYEKDENKSFVKFFKVDCDKLNVIADKYDIEVVPTFIFFVKGKKFDTATGGKSKEDFKKLVESAIKKYEKVLSDPDVAA